MERLGGGQREEEAQLLSNAVLVGLLSPDPFRLLPICRGLGVQRVALLPRVLRYPRYDATQHKDEAARGETPPNNTENEKGAV